MGTTVDWNRWLPPRKIRSYGDLEFKPGQVWAWRYDDDPIVFRVLEYGRGKDASVKVEGLARLKFDGESPVAMRANGCCVLVQDVGQPEPTPPDNLWQEAYALPPDRCYAPDVCTSVRVMGRDEHGKAYCWKHRALWGTVTREVEDDRSIKTMFESIRKSADEIMLGVFRKATIDGYSGKRQLVMADPVTMGVDGLVHADCPLSRPGRYSLGKVVGRKGENILVAVVGHHSTLEFQIGDDISLDGLPDHAKFASTKDAIGFFGDPKAGTFSNVLADPKPLTTEALQKACEAMDTIKTRDAETKKRYDDIVMSGLKTHMDKPIVPDLYYWRPFLDAPAAKPKLTEAEITRLQWMADDGGRHAPELFPVIREGAPRTQSQSIAAGLGIWGTRGDAKLPPDPKPYPHVSDEDLLPDA